MSDQIISVSPYSVTVHHMAKKYDGLASKKVLSVLDCVIGILRPLIRDFETAISQLSRDFLRLAILICFTCRFMHKAVLNGRFGKTVLMRMHCSVQRSVIY